MSQKFELGDMVMVKLRATPKEASGRIVGCEVDIINTVYCVEFHVRHHEFDAVWFHESRIRAMQGKDMADALAR